MRVRNKTIKELKEMGIDIKIYPTTYEEFYERCLQKNNVHFYFYFKMCETDKERDSHNNDMRAFSERDAHNWYDANVLYITYGNNITFCKKENVKSKEITKDYVLKLIEKDKKAYKSAYGDFTLKMKKILQESKIGGLLVYPTTYGIGVYVYYGLFAGNSIKKLDDILKSKGIEYKNEFSDAHWVWRYKISKKKSNLAKID